MKQTFVALSVTAAAVALFGTTANANPPAVVHPIAPVAKQAETPADPPNMITVRYGANNLFTSKQLDIGWWLTCNNALFGDPAPNQKKACYINGNKVADEGAKFTTPAPECARVAIKYTAVNGANKIRNFCPSRWATCNNAVFGVDPAVGLVKHCELMDGKHVANENQDFMTATAAHCLCNGKSLGELDAENHFIKDAFHD